MLKETKCAFPSFYGPAYAETTAIMATLGQVWKHRGAGDGENPFRQTRDEMDAAGLPTQWFPRSRSANRRGTAAFAKPQKAMFVPPGCGGVCVSPSGAPGPVTIGRP